MYLVTKAGCPNEYTEAPDLFVIELTKELLGTLKKRVAEAKKTRSRDGDFSNASYSAGGDWINSFGLPDDYAEALEDALDGNNYVFVDDMPELEEVPHVLGHKVLVHYDGDISFEAYDGRTVDDFYNRVVSFDKMMNPKVVRLIQDSEGVHEY